MGLKQPFQLRHYCGALALIAVLCLSPRANAQWITQEIQLQPGWNGVHLFVQPAQAQCEVIFTNTAVQKVFWWKRTGTGMEFDFDPQNTFPRSADWQYWFADNPAIGTFGTLLAGESYEIFVATNAAPFVLSVKGCPVLNPTRWIPGEPNLVGLPAATNLPVSFRKFFSFSPDFVVDASTATVFRVTGMSNTAERVWNPANSTVIPGEACWVVAGATARQYGGPLRVEADSPARLLNFGSSMSPRTLTINNVTSTNRLVQITHLASETPPAVSGVPALLGKTPLLFKVAASDSNYEPLPDALETNIPAMSSLALSLVPDPQGLTNGVSGSAWQSVIRVADSNNTEFFFATVDVAVGVSCDGSISSQLDPTGLWVGEVSVTDVERAPTREGALNAWSANGPVPVSRPFAFRVIIHVDTNGEARLLQRALVAWRPSDPTVEPLQDPTMNGTVAILASEQAAETYSAAHADAKIVRVSSSCFPVMEPVGMKTGGVFGAAMLFDVTIPYDDQVNPFVHRYHPQHDNLRYDNGVASTLQEGVESYTVTRAMAFTFAAIDPDRGTANRQWGVTERGGSFEETITGVNKTIRARGTFRLTRASRVGGLLR